MGQVVNLRTARKRAVRTQAEAKAAENRQRSSRSRADRLLEAAKSDKTERDLEGHRLDVGVRQ
jgi:hypothetical protein